MKLSGKYRAVFHPRRKVTVMNPVPATREEAFAEGLAVYNPMEICAYCGFEAPVFTITDTCKGCAQINRKAVYDEARDAGEPLGLDAARDQGKDYYYQDTIFETCGHIGKTTLDGKCYECRDDRPREAARARGETWYKPRRWDVCKKVHEGSLRRVYDRACKQCLDEKAKAPNADPVIDIREGWPEDQTLDRSVAREMGLKIYRTGKPCKRGHIDWRYVSNGGCLKCMGKV